MLHSALNVPCVSLTESYDEFVTQLYAQAGNPTDPIERMMLQQLALVHFRIADLHVQAAGTKSVEGQRLLVSCAARLQGEWRKTALARQTLRSTMPKSKRDGSRLKIAVVG